MDETQSENGSMGVREVLAVLQRQIASTSVPARANVSFMEGQLQVNNQEHADHLNELALRHKSELEYKTKRYEEIISRLKSELENQETVLAVTKGRLEECRDAKKTLLEEKREAAKRYEERVNELEASINECQKNLYALSKEKERYKEGFEKIVSYEEAAKLHEKNLEVTNGKLAAAEKKIREHELQIEKLEAEKKQLEDGMNAREKDNEDLRKQLAEYIDKFQNQVKSEDSAASVLKDQLAKVEKELDGMKTKLADEKNRSSELEKEMEQVRRENALSKVEVRCANRVKSDIERQLTEKSDELAALQKEKTALIEDKTALKIRLDGLEETMEQLRNEIKTKNDDYESLMSIKDVICEQKLTLDSDNTSLRHEVDLLKAKVQDYDELKILLANKEGMIAEKESEIKIKDNQISNLKKSVETLKLTITTLDEQLTSFEAAIQTKCAEIEDGEKIRNLLENENKDIREQLRKVKIDLNEAKSLKSFTEKRLEITESNLRTQSQTKESEVHAMMEKLTVASNRNEELSEEVSSLMTQVSALEGEKFELRKSVESMKAEKDRLNKDLSSCVKTIVNVKEENISLQKGLGEAITKAQSYKDKFLSTQEKLSKLEDLLKVHEVTFNTTVEQQQKLIDHMANTLATLYEKKKKKHTIFTPKRNEKDLYTPSKSATTPINRNRLGVIGNQRRVSPADPIVLEQEKLIIERLEQKRADLQTKLYDLQSKGTPLTQKTPTLPAPKKEENILLKERSNTIATAPTNTRPASGRAHKFYETRCNAIKKCMTCWEPIYKARPVSQCRQCKYVFHLACAVTAGDTCGLSENKAYEIQKDISMMRAEPINNGCDDDVRACVKVRSNQMESAEYRLLIIEGNKLKMYVSDADRKSARPAAMYPLNEKTSVYFRIDRAESQTSPKDQMAFAMKVTFYNDQGDSSYLYMFHRNKHQKRYWIQAILKYTRMASSSGSSVDTTVASDSSFCSEDNKENQTVKLGEKVIVTQPFNKLYVNCAMYFDAAKTYLLGCDDGLYSAKNVDSTPVKIEGPSSIYGIAILTAAKHAIFIEGPKREVTTVYSGLLKTCAEAAECSQPKFKSSVVPHTSDCYMFATRSETFEDTVVAAAYSNGLMLCKMDRGDLTVVKQFLIEDSITSLLMTPQSVFFGSNNVYELDTKTFETEEFLDRTDDAIYYVQVINECHGSYPVAILDVSKSRELESNEPEYLICFQDIGIFVDSFGRRSRDGDVLWSQVPIAFEYRHPFLYIVHFHSVEVQKLDEMSYTRICKSPRSRDKTKSRPESQVVMPEIRFLPVNSKSSPNYVGEGAHGVVVAVHEAKSTKVLELFAS